MKKIIAIFMISLFILLAGCNKQQVEYTMNMTLLTTNYMRLVQSYEKIENVVKKNWEVFSEEDQQKILKIESNIKLIIEKTGNVKNYNYYVPSTHELGYLYTLGKDSYEIGTELFLTYKDDLTTSDILMIQMYDNQLKEIDKSIQRIIKDPESEDINDILGSILDIAAVGSKIIIPLLAL
jgi:hypothetical protein